MTSINVVVAKKNSSDLAAAITGKSDLSRLTMKKEEYNFSAIQQQRVAQEQADLKARELNFVANEGLAIKKTFSVIHDGKAFHKLLESELGLDKKSWSYDERLLRVDLTTGFPAVDPTTKHNYREVVLAEPITQYTVFDSKADNARFVVISGTTKTTYMIIRPGLSFSFVIDQSSLTPEEAVINLYTSNLNKGPLVFQKTAKLLPLFFNQLFRAVYKEPTILSMVIRHVSGSEVRVKLYVGSDDSSKDMISVCGQVFDVKLNEYPGQQINRGYFGEKKKADGYKPASVAEDV